MILKLMFRSQIDSFSPRSSGEEQPVPTGLAAGSNPAGGTVPKLTQEQLEKLANRLLGTADSIEVGIESIGIESEEFQDDSDVIDQLVNVNVERCQGCDWWFESDELVNPDDDDDIGHCEDCRES